MGYLLHRAIIVDGFEPEYVLAARNAAVEIFARHGLPQIVTGVYGHAINGGATFMVVPDGSKEGWENSDRGDKARDDLIAWLTQARKGDRQAKKEPMYLDWVEVVVSDEVGRARVERSTVIGDE